MITGWSSYNITGTGISLTDSSSGLADFHINTQNGKGNIFYKITITVSGGTFVGHSQWHGQFFLIPDGPLKDVPLVVEATMHAVFQGTGDYQGWTLTFRIEGGVTEGIMLIP